MSTSGGITALSSSQISSLNRLQELSKAIAESTTRLSTLKRINSPADDPSGFVQASFLESELSAAEAALEGISQADALLNTASSAASDISVHLQTARGLALAAADNTLTSEQVAANQLELDSIIDSIDQLAQASFGGRRLLDGSSSFSTSGVDTAAIDDVKVLKKKTAEDISVAVTVDTQATQATDSYDNSTPLSSSVTVSVEGSRGSTSITFSAAASTQDIVDAFNDTTYLTGITAAVNGSTVDLTSTEYGSDAVIEITEVSGTFQTASGNSAQGTDAVATVNGQQVTGDGTKLRYFSTALALEIDLDPTSSGALNAFTVSGEGLQFVLGTSPNDTARTGLARLTSTSLGNTTGKLNSLKSGGANSLTAGNAATALQIVDDAIADVTQAQAVIGAFEGITLETASNLLSDKIEHTSAALSSIQDVDLGLETALLSNLQLLQQTAFESLTIGTLNDRRALDLLQTVSSGF